MTEAEGGGEMKVKVDIADLHKQLAEYKQTPDAYALHLKLTFAELLIRFMQKRGFSVKELAEISGFGEGYLEEVLHSNTSLTFDEAGLLLCKLNALAGIFLDTDNRISSVLNDVKEGEE